MPNTHDQDDVERMSVIVRTVSDTTEVLAGSADRAHLEQLVAELGEGHRVVSMPVLSAKRGFVAHVWCCRAIVDDDQVVVQEPYRLRGASRIVLDSADVPSERVRTDTSAGELEASVFGAERRYVVAFAATADRARRLAETEAREHI